MSYSDTEAVVRATLERCHRLADGLQDIYPVLDALMPLQSDLSDHGNLQKFASLALLKRVEQIQDMIGRLMRAILTWHLEDPREMTRRDIADWMEKLHFLDDAREWINLTELRNRLVHEYPITEAEQVDRINESWSAAKSLTAIVGRIDRHLIDQGLIG